ncbi:hypothetical protein ESZ50_09005 [Weissella muntiaci]|uniref:Uncharacterized protein n=1 Tax=Weissella muntiaci TaxID=2508881 RepID=A0A6C2C3Q5_9LACO|nr:hypothetical protein [Weissella muntiaci]TYC48372.1 hypothetical protein ESZ50_09005 [Weissella muntiaci]
MVVEAKVKHIEMDALFISDVVENLKVYSKASKSLMHPLLRSYISITLPFIELWLSVDAHELMTYQEFRQHVIRDVVDVWLTNRQPKFLKQLIMDHAVATADKLSNIAFGGM